MRLPRSVSARDLVRALERFGYVVVRRSGSHIRLSTMASPTHSVTIPDHDALRVGTLAGVVADVAIHHSLSKDEVSRRLFGQ